MYNKINIHMCNSGGGGFAERSEFGIYVYVYVRLRAR